MDKKEPKISNHNCFLTNVLERLDRYILDHRLADARNGSRIIHLGYYPPRDEFIDGVIRMLNNNVEYKKRGFNFFYRDMSWLLTFSSQNNRLESIFIINPEDL